jgi:uncharacterized membrane protein
LSKITGPIHTFQTGGNQMFKDLAIESLDAPDFGFAHQPVNLSVTVTASAMGNKKIPLVLKEGDNVIVSKIVEIREEESHFKVDLQFTPRKLGQRIYTLSLPLFAGESITSNNRKDFQVKVVRDRIRVLHLNGRPSWDARFLREVLVNNPKVDLLSFFILRSLSDDVAAPTTELSLIPFPSNLLFSDYLNSFDLVVFQNFKYSPFIDKKHLSNIKSYVENGGAFLMVGGELSFQGGGYERTGIEDILPVTFKRSSHPFVNQEFQVRTAGKLSHHPILRLEKDLAINLKTWQSLPRLNGANTGLQVKPWGQALADFSLKGGKRQPVLVVGKKGKGRTALLATDSSWSWNFLKVGEGGSGRYYQKFWNNVIAWLSADPDTRVLQIETDKEKYREGEQVLIKVKVLNEDYSPAIKEKVSLKLTTPSGGLETHALVTGAAGEKEFQFNPREEGFYRVAAQVKRGKQNITETVSFGVFTETAEFQKPRVNPGLLKKISQISGGDYTILDPSTRLSAHSFPNPEVLVKARSKVFSLWNNWWSYGLLVGFLFVDWWIRRKSGLS